LFVLVLAVSVALTALLVTANVGAQPGRRQPLAPAQVAYPITYQGRLTDGSGSPVANQAVNITFRLYGQSSGGTAVFTQTRAVTTTAEGLFTTELLIDPPLGVNDLSSLWLGVQVGGDGEMTPRQRVGGAAYAFTLVPGNGISGTVNLTDVPSAILVLTNTGDGHALIARAQKGLGGIFVSEEGHALAADGPVMLKNNLRQVALHRWYEVNMADITQTVGLSPTGILFDGSSLWVTNQGSNSVTRLRSADGAVVGEYPVGSAPIGLTYDGARVWVANANDDTVSRILASDPSISSTISVGNNPNGLCFDGYFVWVVNRLGNSVSRIVASTGVVSDTFAVGANPRTCTFDGTFVWVTNYQGNTVNALRPDSGLKVFTVTVGTNPVGSVFDGANVWVANAGSDSLTKSRASDGQVLGTVPAGDEPRGVVFDGYHIWVTNYAGNRVTKLQAINGAPVGSYPFALGSGPRGITFDGSDIWIALSDAHAITKK